MIGRLTLLLGGALLLAGAAPPEPDRTWREAQAETPPPPAGAPAPKAGGKKGPAPAAPEPAQPPVEPATPPAPAPPVPAPAPEPAPANPAAPAPTAPAPPAPVAPLPTAPSAPAPAPGPSAAPPAPLAPPSPPAAPPPAFAPPPASAPPGPSAPPPLPNGPPPAGSNALQPAPTLDFAPLVQAFTLIRDTAAYVSPSLDAPQMYPLRAGTPVMSAARSRDGSWVVALTEDGRAAYLRAEDLGPYDPSHAPLPPTVSGEAEVVDTATLIVNGQRLALSGVEGEGGEYARQLQALINSQGRVVSCEPQQRGYLCKLADGMDIARAALYNGAARAADDASDDYRQQAESARAGRRGIWR